VVEERAVHHTPFVELPDPKRYSLGAPE